MSKYGTKHTCWSCGTKFYDLGRPDPKCPKCGADPAEAPATVGAVAAAEEEEDYDLDDIGLGGEEEE